MLAPAELDELLDLFDLGAVVAPPTFADGGVTAEIWRMETTSGCWAVKMARPRFAVDEPEGIATRFQEAAVACGLNAPRVRRTGSGSALAAVGNRMVSVLSWLDLLPFDLTLDPVEIGWLLAGLHRVGGRCGLVDPMGRVHPWYGAPIGAAHWHALVDRAAAADAPFAAAFAECCEELVALESLLVDAPDNPIICHRDLFADNLRATASGPLAVFDFDNAGLADPGQELAALVVEFATDLQAGSASADLVRARAIMDSYADAGGPGRVDGLGSFTMPIAQRGHITELAARLWLEAESDADRDRLAAWAHDMTHYPLTREVLNALLDA